jgi:lipoprotein-anchoring transpeptidase ErfK/SrfK
MSAKLALMLSLVLGTGIFHGHTLAHAQLAPKKGEPVTADALNAAQMTPPKGEALNPGILKAQVLLDRAGFSPGAIDARNGENFRKALIVFQQANGLAASGALDEPTWAKLTQNISEPVVTTYTIAAGDLKGPFVKEIPKDYRKMAKLKYLGYRGPREALAEKFHMVEDLLTTLNPKASFEQEGASILVTNVRQPGEASNEKPAENKSAGKKSRKEKSTKEKSPKVAKLIVDKAEASVRAFAADGSLLAYYPASVGSSEKPAPTGSFKVTKVAPNPTYRYNPDFAFRGQKADKPVEIASGPNNPVGAVWIALTAKTYGIHGTPHPDKVSKTESHGCIRLTNWDVLALSRMVGKGTVVELR